MHGQPEHTHAQAVIAESREVPAHMASGSGKASRTTRKPKKKQYRQQLDAEHDAEEEGFDDGDDESVVSVSELEDEQSTEFDGVNHEGSSKKKK